MTPAKATLLVTSRAEDRSRAIERIAALSIGVALIVMALKYAAYRVTGSVALYSDALESIVNVITGIAAFIAVRVSATPADAEHPFGHHKAEYFSAVLEGVLIVVAAFVILREAWQALVEPRQLMDTGWGLALSSMATAINGVWAWLLVTRGREHRSPALVADGWHLATDVLTSVGVLAGLLIAAATGAQLLDPLLAALVAANVLWAGFKLTRESMSGLMDEAASADIADRIRAAIVANGEGALQVHDIRTRLAARATFIEFHLVVPGTMTVAKSHDICDRLEDAIEADVPGAQVLIHVEPELKAKSDGAVDLCARPTSRRF